MLDRIGARRYSICMLSLTFPMISAICAEFDELINDAVYEDIAISICSTHFSTEHNITMKEAQSLVYCALHMTGTIVYEGVQ